MSRYSIEDVGTCSFTGDYNYTDVTLYLLSCILKSKGAVTKDLVSLTNLSLRQTQRYIYNSLFKNVTNINLEIVSKLLSIYNLSLSFLFKYVDEFIKNRKEVAIFNSDNTFTMYLTYEYLEQDFDIKNLIRVLKARRKVQNEYPEYVKEYDGELNKYPFYLIKKYREIIYARGKVNHDIHYQFICTHSSFKLV